MHKDGKTADNGRTRQKYCCPFRQSKTGACPCSHKNWNNGKKNRGCTKYKTVPDDYRLSIDRSCLYFRRTYALRTECERWFKLRKPKADTKGPADLDNYDFGETDDDTEYETEEDESGAPSDSVDD